MFATFFASASTSFVALVSLLARSRSRTAATLGVRWLAALALVCSWLLVSVNAHAVSWGTAASLTTARMQHSATLLPSGKVVLWPQVGEQLIEFGYADRANEKLAK